MRSCSLFSADRKNEILYEDCSAIIVGKAASATGEVIFGHNEDDSHDNVMVQYVMPRGRHNEGDLLEFEDDRAKIPNVKETFRYYWSETRADWRAPFSDIFVNEWGVAVASDSCGRSKEDEPHLTDGGIGYALGHIVAQRAKTARQGVRIAADLIEHYGYSGHARAYSIVDKDEGWVLQVVYGKHYAAQRVKDDEVMFIPNWFTIGNVLKEENADYLLSPNLISYAVKRGWYTSKNKGSHEDFNFAQAFQDPTVDQSGNIVRHMNALRMITGESEHKVPIFSVKPSKKMGVSDVMSILRSHYEGTQYDLSHNYTNNPHRTLNRTICTATTLESFVLEMRENPLLNCMWRTTLNPCTSPYVPWYTCLDKIPLGYGWIDPQAGLKTHFDVPSEDLGYRPGRAWWAFRDVQDLCDSSYSEVEKIVKEKRDLLENGWKRSQADIESMALLAYEKDPEKCISILTEYTSEQARLAWRTWRDLFRELLCH